MHFKSNIYKPISTTKFMKKRDEKRIFIISIIVIIILAVIIIFSVVKPEKAGGFWFGLKDELPTLKPGEILVPEGLVAYYKFDGNTLDSSGNNNHGVFYGDSEDYSDGVDELALNFRGYECPVLGSDDILGSDDHVLGCGDYVKIDANNIDESYDISSSFLFWVYPLSEGVIMHKGDSSLRSIGCDHEPLIMIDSTGKIFAQADGCRGAGRIGSAQLQMNKWNHVVVVFNDNLGKIFVDGQLKVSNAKDYSFTSKETGQNNLYIGASSNNGVLTHFFNGSIDEVMIYNRSLNVSDVAKIYYTQGTKVSITRETNPVSSGIFDVTLHVSTERLFDDEIIIIAEQIPDGVSATGSWSSVPTYSFDNTLVWLFANNPVQIIGQEQIDQSIPSTITYQVSVSGASTNEFRGKWGLETVNVDGLITGESSPPGPPI